MALNQDTWFKPDHPQHLQYVCDPLLTGELRRNWRKMAYFTLSGGDSFFPFFVFELQPGGKENLFLPLV